MNIIAVSKQHSDVGYDIVKRSNRKRGGNYTFHNRYSGRNSSGIIVHAAQAETTAGFMYSARYYCSKNWNQKVG